MLNCCHEGRIRTEVRLQLRGFYIRKVDTKVEFEFKNILGEHEARYPLMEIQDYVKLAYQNEFGPRHLAEKDRLHQGIQSEMAKLSDAEGEYETEAIGNGLSRLSLCGLPHPDTDAQLIAELMILTMDHHSGTPEGLERKLKALEEKLGPDAKQWLDEYRAGGCPPANHSEVYRSTYQPYYRVMKTEYANWFPALSEIASLLAAQQPVVISIDGRCGSGKSSLAAVIKEVFSCNVFHMDDYYLPPDRRADDWETIPAGNMDLERFKMEVLQPVKEGKDVLYQPFDCQTGSLAEPSAVPPTQLTVIEGSYSQHPELSDQYELKIFITSGPEVQRKRLTEREGDYVKVFFSRWMPLEERYFTAFDIENKSDMILDTSRFW